MIWYENDYNLVLLPGDDFVMSCISGVEFVTLLSKRYNNCVVGQKSMFTDFVYYV